MQTAATAMCYSNIVPEPPSSKIPSFFKVECHGTHSAIHASTPWTVDAPKTNSKSQDKQFYKFITADKSQICNGRIYPAVKDSSSARNPKKENESNTDSSPTPSQELQQSTTPSKIHYRKKSHPRHRNPVINRNVSSIMHAPRFSSAHQKTEMSSSDSSPSQRNSELSKSLPPQRRISQTLDLTSVLQRSASSSWTPGVEFSSAMEVYFFMP